MSIKDGLIMANSNEYLFKDILMKKITESIIKDFNRIRDANIFIKDDNGHVIKDLELIEFLENTKDEKYLDFVYESIYDPNVDIDIEKFSSFIKFKKTEICLTFLEESYEIKNIKNVNDLSDREKIDHMFEIVYSERHLAKYFEEEYEGYYYGYWLKIYNGLLESKNMFFGQKVLISDEEKSSVLIFKNHYQINRFTIRDNIYVYDENEELYLNKSDDLLSFGNKLIAIYSYIENNNFDKKLIKLYSEDMTFDKIYKDNPTIYQDFPILWQDKNILCQNTIRLIRFSSLNENYPYHSCDPAYLYIVKDTIKNISKLMKMNIN